MKSDRTEIKVHLLQLAGPAYHLFARRSRQWGMNKAYQEVYLPAFLWTEMPHNGYFPPKNIMSYKLCDQIILPGKYVIQAVWVNF